MNFIKIQMQLFLQLKYLAAASRSTVDLSSSAEIYERSPLKVWHAYLLAAGWSSYEISLQK